MKTQSADEAKKIDDEEVSAVAAPDAVEEDGETVEELRDYKTRIREANQKVMERRHRLDELKEQVKDAKKAWEGAQVMLSDLIAEEKEEYPLFDQKQGTSVVADEAWRSVHVSELELPERILEALLEHKPKPLETLGDLSDFSAKHQWIDIQGIGPAKAEQIDNAFDEFWAKHPEYTTPATPEPEGVTLQFQDDAYEEDDDDEED